MTDHLSQCERILNWLLTGDTIDFYKCLEQIGSNNLKGRIFDCEDYARKGRKPFDILLKRPIQRDWRYLENGKRIRVYWLAKIESYKQTEMVI
jgi:hypothetical protein